MIEHSRKFVTVCGAAVLALGLAACSSSGGRQMSGGGTTPEPTELDRARMAALAAKDAARMKSDEADAEADKADEALMGIAVLQTAVSTAKMPAMEARAAADAAMAAYEKANAEYEKAKAAGDVTAAVTAQIAAERAKAQAEAQAKTAREKAAAAAAAAMKDVKVASDGKTFSVGSVSIAAGAPKRTFTRDGVNRVTGKNADLLSTTARTERSAVPYAAGPPEKRAQPAVARRGFRIVMGSITDSDDDTVRLFLADKYLHSGTNKTVSIFRDLGGVDPTATASGENPYGTVDVSGTPAPIMRAEGEFYMVPGNAALTKRNANGATIAWNTRDANAATGLGGGIYYYMANNTKRWLRLNQSATDTSGVVTLTYDNISVYENVRFPDAKPYEHINLGLWVPLKEDGGPLLGAGTGGDLYPDLGIAFVSTLPGQAVTPPASIPVVGTAAYHGQAHFSMRNRANHSSEPGEIKVWTVNTTTTANFSNNTISVNMGSPGTLSGMIDGNGFSGTRITNITTTYVTPSVDGSIYTASFSGNFFGPEAREVGGVFDVTSEDMKHGAWRGAFGGRSD